MKRIDEEIHKLCEEIDYWKAEAEYWKAQFEKERSEMIKTTNQQLEDSKRGVANALMLAMSVTDNEDGSLSISAENRKDLAESYK